MSGERNFVPARSLFVAALLVLHMRSAEGKNQELLFAESALTSDIRLLCSGKTASQSIPKEGAWHDLGLAGEFSAVIVVSPAQKTIFYLYDERHYTATISDEQFKGQIDFDDAAWTVTAGMTIDRFTGRFDWAKIRTSKTTGNAIRSEQQGKCTPLTQKQF
jgi:hypothetical protein